MKHLFEPKFEDLAEAHLDITKPLEAVEVKLDYNNMVLWINVGPVCVLRICKIPEVMVVEEP